MFFVACIRLIFINSFDVENDHYLNVLEDGNASEIVVLSDEKDQRRTRNSNHDIEEIPAHKIIFIFKHLPRVFKIDYPYLLLSRKQKHWNQMNFRINTLFKRISKESHTDECVGDICQINLKMKWAHRIKEIK